MNTTPDNLSANQSLDIITEMIRQAKGNAKNNTFYFLLWGWVIVLANLGMFLLIQLDYPYPYVVWIITVPAWLLTMFRAYKQGSSRPSTHLDKISSWLWIIFGVIVFTLVFFGYKINFHLNAVILIVSAIPTFISGVILKFKPLMMGGVTFWVSGIACFLVPGDFQFLIGALAITCGYLIPGYMLKNKPDA